MATEKRIVVNGISLRRDNDYNYNKVGEKFIPKKGEVCLVDTAKSGLRAVVGDGVTKYAELGFADDIFVKAYFNKANGKFYKGVDFLEEEIGNTNRIYIDLNNPNHIYYYNGADYVVVGAGELPTASAEVSGIMKLYNTKGNNVDGTISQFIFTQEINKKIEMNIDVGKETVIFGYDLENRV